MANICGPHVGPFACGSEAVAVGRRTAAAAPARHRLRTRGLFDHAVRPGALHGGPPGGFSPSIRPADLPPGGGTPLFRTVSCKPIVNPPPRHIIEISTMFAEKIIVPVDTHQTSKLANEKRMRNAGASARFRQHRKEKEQDRDREIARLQEEKRELQTKLQDAQRERDFYRNQLRNIMR
jgi:hypothetical protein